MRILIRWNSETMNSFAGKLVCTTTFLVLTAVRVAGRMQKEVTMKRGQIDTLNSKLMWLEEAQQNITEVNSSVVDLKLSNRGQ